MCLTRTFALNGSDCSVWFDVSMPVTVIPMGAVKMCLRMLGLMIECHHSSGNAAFFSMAALRQSNG